MNDGRSSPLTYQILAEHCGSFTPCRSLWIHLQVGHVHFTPDMATLWSSDSSLQSRFTRRPFGPVRPLLEHLLHHSHRAASVHYRSYAI